MKTLFLAILVFFMLSCSKENNDKLRVTSLDQISGIWKWESTCGGIIAGNCAYSSETYNVEIEFSSNNRYIERINKEIYLMGNYSIVKTNETSGRLIVDLDSEYNNGSSLTHIENFINIVDNHLDIAQGEGVARYDKIK